MYRPDSVFFSGGLLLCLTFGLTLAGIHESYLARNWGWFWAFVGGETIVIVLYFWNVYSWLAWTRRPTDYDFVDPHVSSADEFDNHQGEHRDA